MANNIIINEYPQSSKSVNSVFEVWSIGACVKFEPVKEMEATISSVEFVEELIEVELQEISLNTMIGIKDTPPCVTDGYVYSWKHFADESLVFHNIRIVLGHNLVFYEGGIRMGSIRGRTCAAVHSLSNLVFLYVSFQIGKHFHLDMPYTFSCAVCPHSSPGWRGTLSHDKNRSLLLATVTTLEWVTFLSLRCFRREEALVKFHLVEKPIKPIALAHDITKLVHHIPYWLVTFPAQLCWTSFADMARLVLAMRYIATNQSKKGSLFPCITVPERRVVS